MVVATKKDHCSDSEDREEAEKRKQLGQGHEFESDTLVETKRCFSDAENRMNATLALNDLDKFYKMNPEEFEENLNSAVQGLLDYGPPDNHNNDNCDLDYFLEHDRDPSKKTEAEKSKEKLINLGKSLNANLIKRKEGNGHNSFWRQIFIISAFILSTYLIINGMTSLILSDSKSKHFSRAK